MYDTKDKVAIITGAASGFGKAYAIKLLESGAKGVVIADLREDAGRETVAELADRFGEGRLLYVKSVLGCSLYCTVHINK